MPDKIITALFDSREDAQTAQQQLAAAGIGQNQVQITSGEAAGASNSLGTTGDLATVMQDRSLPDADRATFAEGLRRGAYLLTAHVNDTRADDAARILDDSPAVDLDERAEQWRSTGWTGGGLADLGNRGNTGRTLSQNSGENFSSSGGQLGGGEVARGFSASGDLSQRVGQSVGAGQEQTIPIVEEQLKVGKREVERGGVRVRSFVVETPVHEQVRLREEHVSVERRPADQRLEQGLRAGDDLLQERTIELTESSEEAVVAKEARVVEEVVLRREVEERTETIDDTVRRTEVEVENTTAANRGRDRI